MVKVRPTSPSFVLVWNTPEAYNGTHILKSIAKILKEYNGKPARFVKKKSATNGNRVQSKLSCAQLFERRLALTTQG